MRYEYNVAISLKFNVGDFTVHRIIEQETTFLQANDALPTLTPELLAENRGGCKRPAHSTPTTR